MNHKFFSAFSAVAIALIATAPLSRAVVYSPSQFNAALKSAIGTKTGPSAYNAAAKLLKKALGDKKNKKNVVKYVTSCVKALKKPVKIPLQGKSRSTLANALVNGYFKGLSYNPMDSKFSAALKKLSSYQLPGSQKTEATAQLIANPVLAYNSKKGGSAADVNFINGVIYPATGQPTPTPAS